MSGDLHIWYAYKKSLSTLILYIIYVYLDPHILGIFFDRPPAAAAAAAAPQTKNPDLWNSHVSRRFLKLHERADDVKPDNIPGK